MFRALSTRRSYRGYEKLGDEGTTALLDVKLSRSTTVPAKFWDPNSSSRKVFAEPRFPPKNPEAKQAKKASKLHPFFGLLETRRKKKPTADPKFSRYLEYAKEGGILDLGPNMPAIYFK